MRLKMTAHVRTDRAMRVALWLARFRLVSEIVGEAGAVFTNVRTVRGTRDLKIRGCTMAQGGGQSYMVGGGAV